MKRLLVSTLFAAALVSGQEFHVGAKVSDFDITDVKGATAHFASLRGDVTVVIFVSTQCPVSNGYNERMKALYSDYTSRGVRFVFINANHNETPEQVEGHSREHGFTFAVYKDANNQVSDRFGATVTPETYVIDRMGMIRYHGSIDDSQNEARIHTHGLRTALDAVLSGKEVPVTETKAFGCTIKRARKTT